LFLPEGVDSACLLTCSLEGRLSTDDLLAGRLEEAWSDSFTGIQAESFLSLGMLDDDADEDRAFGRRDVKASEGADCDMGLAILLGTALFRRFNEPSGSLIIKVLGKRPSHSTPT
jgi:hypothetical protein